MMVWEHITDYLQTTFPVLYCIVTRFGLRDTDLEIYDNETEIEVCVEGKPPYNIAVCPVGFHFNLKVSVQGDNDGKLLYKLFIHS